VEKVQLFSAPKEAAQHCPPVLVSAQCYWKRSRDIIASSRCVQSLLDCKYTKKDSLSPDQRLAPRHASRKLCSIQLVLTQHFDIRYWDQTRALLSFSSVVSRRPLSGKYDPLGTLPKRQRYCSGSQSSFPPSTTPPPPESVPSGCSASAEGEKFHRCYQRSGYDRDRPLQSLRTKSQEC
jgi:hypothetical protein